MVLYVCLGTPAGYVSARIYKSFGGEKWKSNVLLTSMLCPGVVFAHFFIMNLVLWYEGSSAAIPFFTLVALLALWFGVSVPLTFVGAFFGFRKRAIEHPVRTNQIPRQIPDQSVYTQPIPGIVMGGVLPFGCIFIQLFFVLNSIWSSQIYYMYGFLFLVFVILIITCSETTILLCYFHLCAEVSNRILFTPCHFDIKFSALFAGLSLVVAQFLDQWLYRFLFVCVLRPLLSDQIGDRRGSVDVLVLWIHFNHGVYLLPAYRHVFLFCTVLTIFFSYKSYILFLGTIGFFACWWFTRKIYSVVKVD